MSIVVNQAAADSTQYTANNNGKTLGESGGKVGFTSADANSPVSAINELKKNWTTTGANEAIGKMENSISNMESIIGNMRDSSQTMADYTVELEYKDEIETKPM